MKTFIAFVIDIIITSFTTMWIWNNVFSQLFGITTITIMQGWAVSLAISYFFKTNTINKEEDNFTQIVRDIVYTILLWLITYVVCLFAF